MNPPIHPELSSPVPTFELGGVILDRSSGVKCPACQSELVIGELEGCQFAGCRECEGMLFQQSVFAKLVQHLRATTSATVLIPDPMDAGELKVDRTCPSCLRSLETHAYGGAGNAVIDTCIGCGLIWLDAGEMTKLVRAPGKR